MSKRPILRVERKMRGWIVLLAALFVLSGLTPTSSAGCHPDQPCGPGEPGNQNQNANQQNRSGSDAGGTNASQGAGNKTDPAADKGPKGARHDEAERRKAQARAWQDALDGRGGGRAAAERNAALDNLPSHVRDRVGRLVEEDGVVQGTYVSFAPDRNAGILRDLQSGGTLLFDEVYTPLELGSSASMSVHGKTFQVADDGWRFRLNDHPSVAMSFQASGDHRFMLVVTNGTSVTMTSFGLELVYPADGGSPRVARLVGDVTRDSVDPQVYFVAGEATFHISAERALLQAVSNKARPQIEDAMTERKIGAEATVLRTEDGIFDETIRYEDLSLAIETGARDAPAEAAAYTITVSADHRPGKTIVVTFEEGLVDASDLTFRYWNVHEDGFTEAPIVQASSLQDVLDPDPDNAEYWVVQDVDGTQVLLAIPHFSVHQIELMSVVDFVLERPSLVIGTIGAIAVVSLATVAMFRRPEDH